METGGKCPMCEANPTGKGEGNFGDVFVVLWVSAIIGLCLWTAYQFITSPAKDVSWAQFLGFK